MIIDNNYRCLLCNNELILSEQDVYDTRFGLDQRYEIARCPICKTEQIQPVPSFGELCDLYKRFYNFLGINDTRYTAYRERFLQSVFYRFWLSVDGDVSFHCRKGTGNLLDIGCNEGRGLVFFKKNGFYAEGLEVNENAAAAARLKGFNVYSIPLESFVPQSQYEVSVLTNVIEHSLDPKRMLKNTSRLLRNGGQLWLSCPNGRSWLRSLFGRYWINWHVPFHILHFSATGLKRLLDEAGFEIAEIRQETPSLWVAHSMIARLFARRGKPTRQLRNPLLVAGLMLFVRGFLFPVLWLGNKLGRGDCLVVTARKR